MTNQEIAGTLISMMNQWNANVAKLMNNGATKEQAVEITSQSLTALVNNR